MDSLNKLNVQSIRVPAQFLKVMVDIVLKLRPVLFGAHVGGSAFLVKLGE